LAAGFLAAAFFTGDFFAAAFLAGAFFAAGFFAAAFFAVAITFLLDQVKKALLGDGGKPRSSSYSSPGGLPRMSAPVR
jgi:predicted PurR-regulated permease PerM